MKLDKQNEKISVVDDERAIRAPVKAFLDHKNLDSGGDTSLRTRSWSVGGKMRWLGLCLLVLPLLAPRAYADILGPDLGTYAVLAGSTVTNVPTSAIFGNVGVSPGSSITGFVDGDGQVTGGTIQPGTQALAQTQLTAAWTYLSGLSGSDLSGDLGGRTLMPGVYNFSSAAQLTGTLTLAGEGIWIFKIGSLLNTASDSSVVFANGAQGGSVFWQVDTATLGTGTAFAGNIIANTSISLATQATIVCGRALARSGAVTLQMNTISIDRCEESGGEPVPEPSTVLLLASGLIGGALRIRRARARV